MEKLRKLFTRKNIFNAFFIVLMIVLLVSPQAKALLIKGLISVGIMRPPTQSEAVTNATPVVNITLRQANGAILQTQQLKGKVLVINFWATWCPPCIAEMPSINEMYLRYKGNANLMVLPVDVDGDLPKSLAFMKENGYSLPVYQLGAAPPQGLLSDAIPTTIIIGKNGQVVASHEGAADYASKPFYEYLEKLLKE